MEKTVLLLENVKKEYDKDGVLFPAVKGVSFSIQKGEILALVGQSGCGKSTLARMISGMTPVSGGAIFLDGERITSEEHRLPERRWRELRKKMQPILQDPRAAISPRMTIGTFLCEPFLCFSLCGKAEALKKSEALLSRVGLDRSFLDRFPNQLSGGELQRVVIARSLALSPSLLLCDEPTSALDTLTQAEVVSLLCGLVREEKMSMLFITHDLSLAAKIASHLLVMHDGEIVERLSAEELLSGKAVHPYTRALLEAALF